MAKGQPQHCRNCLLQEPHECMYPGLMAMLETNGLTLDDTDHKYLRWLAGFLDDKQRAWFGSVCDRIRELAFDHGRQVQQDAIDDASHDNP